MRFCSSANFGRSSSNPSPAIRKYFMLSQANSWSILILSTIFSINSLFSVSSVILDGSDSIELNKNNSSNKDKSIRTYTSVCSIDLIKNFIHHTKSSTTGIRIYFNPEFVSQDESCPEKQK